MLLERVGTILPCGVWTGVSGPPSRHIEGNPADTSDSKPSVWFLGLYLVVITYEQFGRFFLLHALSKVK